MAEDQERVTYFGETDSRGKRVKFGIKSKDRTRHMYVIGKTGMGKSTLLENMAIQDLRNGEGMAFIDPHGKTADLLLEYIPPDRMKDVVYFAPFDLEHPISFNVLEDVGFDKRHLVVSGLMSTFKKIWVDAWSARMEYILTNTLLALIEYPGSTLLGVNRMLADKEYRKMIVENVKDPSVKAFWVEEFAKYTEKFAAEATPAIQNKIGQFTGNPQIRNIIGQSKSSMDIRKIMDEKKILIINLSKGRVGEANANLLGSMLITKIYIAAMSRADVQERELKKLPNFYLYVDEFQSFANESFADILSEARKYKLNLTIAHQYIEQMSEEVRAAVFGNVGTMITFRVGAYDAETLEKEFAPQFTAEDLVNLGIFQMYLKLMINGVSSTPFSASSLPPFPEPVISYRDEIIATSRKQFAELKATVEGNIQKWHDEGVVKYRITEGAAKPQSGQQSSYVRPSISNNGYKGNNTESKSVETPNRNPNPENRSYTPVSTPKDINPRDEYKRKEEPKIEKPPLDEPSDDFVPLKDLIKKVQSVPEVKIAEQKPQINQKPIDKKEPTKENLSGLKSALESALKSKIDTQTETSKVTLEKVPIIENKPEVSVPEKEDQRETPHITKEEKPKESINKTEESPKEIPEKDLKKILGIE